MRFDIFLGDKPASAVGCHAAIPGSLFISLSCLSSILSVNSLSMEFPILLLPARRTFSFSSRSAMSCCNTWSCHWKPALLSLASSSSNVLRRERFYGDQGMLPTLLSCWSLDMWESFGRDLEPWDPLVNFSSREVWRTFIFLGKMKQAASSGRSCCHVT